MPVCIDASEFIELQRRPTMAADLGLMPNDPIRVRHPLERVALVTRLPAAWPARPAAKAAQKAPLLLLQSVARGRLGTRRAVQIQPAPKLRHLRAKTLDLTRLRHYQGFDLGRKTHSTLESQLTASVSASTQKSPTPKPTLTKMTHYGLGVTIFFSDLRLDPFGDALLRQTFDPFLPNHLSAHERR